MLLLTEITEELNFLIDPLRKQFEAQYSKLPSFFAPYKDTNLTEFSLDLLNLIVWPTGLAIGAMIFILGAGIAAAISICNCIAASVLTLAKKEVYKKAPVLAVVYGATALLAPLVAVFFVVCAVIAPILAIIIIATRTGFTLANLNAKSSAQEPIIPAKP